MKRIKNLLSIILVILFVFLLAGCGSPEKKEAQFVKDVESLKGLTNYTLVGTSESDTNLVEYTVEVTEKAIHEKFVSTAKSKTEASSQTIECYYAVTNHKAGEGRVCYKIYNLVEEMDTPQSADPAVPAEKRWEFSYQEYKEGTKLIDLALINIEKIQLDAVDFQWNKAKKAFTLKDDATLKGKYDVESLQIDIHYTIISGANPFAKDKKFSKFVITGVSTGEDFPYVITIKLVDKTKVELPSGAIERVEPTKE